MTKILVIEDDSNVRASALDLLEAEGFTVNTAENGLKGIHLAQQIKPDLIICDVMMPEKDGYGVLATLRAQIDTSLIPFIFLSAKADKLDVRRGMKVGADDYLTKPYSRNDLLDAISSRLGRQSAMTSQFDSRIQEFEGRLNHAQFYDTVTGLPNRLQLQEYFPQTISEHPSEEWVLALVYLSLDRFNKLYDNLASEYSNQLLKETAQRLSGISGLTGFNRLFRIQGDEFVFLFSGLRTELNKLDEICQSVLVKLAAPMMINELEIFTTASLGVCFYNEPGMELETLLRNSRCSMLISKKQGGNCFNFYKDAGSDKSCDLIKLEADLWYAVEHDQLEVYFQPQVNIQNGTITGAEALLRWNHPQRGFISPQIFIPLAEETTLINKIGEWVLRMTCLKMKQWQDAGLPLIRIAVNVASRQLFEPDFDLKVSRILEAASIDPKYIELEITESIMLNDVEATRSMFGKIKAIGIDIAIDDFGTGFSSLSYLKQFPFDTLKIDRCFIQNIDQNLENSAITLATIQMAHSLNLKVVAEGVETAAELDYLINNGCDNIQGFLYSRPMAGPTFRAWLEKPKKAFPHVYSQGDL